MLLVKRNIEMNHVKFIRDNLKDYIKIILLILKILIKKIFKWSG